MRSQLAVCKIRPRRLILQTASWLHVCSQRLKRIRSIRLTLLLLPRDGKNVCRTYTRSMAMIVLLCSPAYLILAGYRHKMLSFRNYI
jgi:hypothetical protein